MRQQMERIIPMLQWNKIALVVLVSVALAAMFACTVFGGDGLNFTW
jgi:hypothetical protein